MVLTIGGTVGRLATNAKETAHYETVALTINFSTGFLGPPFSTRAHTHHRTPISTKEINLLATNSLSKLFRESGSSPIRDSVTVPQPVSDYLCSTKNAENVPGKI